MDFSLSVTDRIWMDLSVEEFDGKYVFRLIEWLFASD